jgi:hypothetical protein
MQAGFLSTTAVTTLTAMQTAYFLLPHLPGAIVLSRLGLWVAIISAMSLLLDLGHRSQFVSRTAAAAAQK